MTWTTDDIPDQSGRVAVVTGGNGGLGLATATALAGAGAHVVMAARDQAKASGAEARIRAGQADARLEVVALDLADLSSVRRAAEAIGAAHPAVDILVNNAGLMAMPERRTADGFEMQFGVNHLGHFAITALLLPAILRADAARVVTVTSTARHLARPHDLDAHITGRYRPWVAYGRSKLANHLFAIGLQRRFAAAGVPAASLVAHPGLSHTDLQSTTVGEGGGGTTSRFFHALTRRIGMTAERGARPQLRAATDPGASGGELYAPRYGTTGPAVRRPVLGRSRLDGAIDTLWEMSERDTGTALDVAAAQASLG